MQPILPLSQRSTTYLSIEGTVEENMPASMEIWENTKTFYYKIAVSEVRYEDMVDNLEAAARRTLDFLDTSWDERVLHFDTHARSKRVRSPTYADVARPVSKRAMGRWRNYQKYLEPHLEKLEPFLKAFGYGE